MAHNADYLATLNEAQYRAVTHPPHVPLQILAGPGSGKTHVLTCRIAHLVSQGIPPSRICAVTFTNKAANEMRERLTRLIGLTDTSRLMMGTFHALCAKFLRQYGTSIGLSNNFTICDAEESKKIVNKLMKQHRTYLQDCDFELTDKQTASLISRAKSKDLSPRQVARGGVNQDVVPDGAAPNPHHTALAMLYEEYQRALKENRSLDFDDLLSHGVLLLDSTTRIAEFCQHVLVDEFQDTNVQQYKLMVRLASHHKRVTIVGDPDQSIYGWRAAEIENLSKMLRDFDKVEQVLLEQNYRSTQAILRTSIAIMAEDKTRIPKSLYSAHHEGSIPTLHACKDERDEGDFIASEIKRLQAYTGGMLKFTDIAILLRTSAMSRAIEASLQREGIPHKVLKGHKFFERMEVKDLLAYLQLVDNPNFAPAFTRAINTPPRSMGEKSVAELLGAATARKCSPIDVAEGIFAGRFPDIKPPAKRKLAPFVSVYRQLRKDAEAGVTPDQLLSRLVDLIEYEAHLKKTQDDWESRWENVQELISFAGQTRAADVDVELPSANPEEAARSHETPLRVFLQASMLASDADGDKSEDGEKDEVIISTCHAAKGLEWPVVFIPAVENGVFPHKRTEDFDEERRLLYVACTRAKAALCLTHCATRVQSPKCELSPFVAAIAKRPSLVSSNPATLAAGDIVSFAQLLKRDVPDESMRQAMIEEYLRLYRPMPQSASATLDSDAAHAIPVYTGPVGFTTAQQVMVSSGYTAPGRAPLLGGAAYAQQWSTPAYRAAPGSALALESSVLPSMASAAFGTASSSTSTAVSPSKPASSSAPRGSKPKSANSKAPSTSRPPSRTLHNYFSKPASASTASKEASSSVLDLTLEDEPTLKVARPSGLQTISEPPRRPLSPANVLVPASHARPVSQTSNLHPPPKPAPSTTAQPTLANPASSATASRKRLGMGRTTGYVNKKFKVHHVAE